ncbi:MAG TPA: hypothetical protein VIF35_11395 [Streptosporangiaceae bacterium]|jgi:hypothetical protein
MRTIFDGLVEEFRAWHLFEQQAGNSPRRDLPDLPGLGLPGYGAAGYRVAGYIGPEYGTPEYGGPEYGDAEYGDAEYGGAEYGGAEYGGAEYDRAPRHGRDLGAGAPQPGRLRGGQR